MKGGLAAALLLAFPALLPAQQVRNPHVTLTLVPEHTEVQGGVPFRVGLRLQVEPGWHVYWQNPGESGIATSVHWALPAGFSASALSWPVPAIEDVAGIRTHVHQGDLVLEATIRPPLGATASPARLTARVSYGVCKDACYPGAATLTVEMPWGRGIPSPAWKEVEAVLLRRLPRPSAPFRTTATIRDTVVILTVRPLAGAVLPDVLTFFPEDRSVIRAAVSVAVPAGAATATIRLPLTASPAGPLRGVLVAGDPRAAAPLGYLLSVRPSP